MDAIVHQGDYSVSEVAYRAGGMLCFWTVRTEDVSAASVERVT